MNDIGAYFVGYIAGISALTFFQYATNSDYLIYYITAIMCCIFMFYMYKCHYKSKYNILKYLESGYKKTKNKYDVNNVDCIDNDDYIEYLQDSDNSEDMSVSLGDLKCENIDGASRNLKNIVTIKDILNVDKIETINDLILLGEYYEKIKINIVDDKNNDKNDDKNFFKYGDTYYTINLKRIHNIKKPLIKLKKMVGLANIKSEIIDMLLYYLLNNTKSNDMMHITLEGPPGCGKTKLAKIISKILNKMEILESDKIVFARSTDMIGEYIGQTSPKTQAVIDSAIGGILFIDEAYSLGNATGKEANFANDCIDVLNQNLSENKNKFICIIAGYKEELDNMFFSVNPGLERRFPFRFSIKGYTHDELLKIFVNKIHKLKWKIHEEIDLKKYFEENAIYFKFYGGDVDTFIQNLKYAYSRRTACSHTKETIICNSDLDAALEKFKTREDIYAKENIKEIRKESSKDKIKDFIKYFKNKYI